MFPYIVIFFVTSDDWFTIDRFQALTLEIVRSFGKVSRLCIPKILHQTTCILERFTFLPKNFNSYIPRKFWKMVKFVGNYFARASSERRVNGHYFSC